jgi:hypothetical protein
MYENACWVFECYVWVHRRTKEDEERVQWIWSASLGACRNAGTHICSKYSCYRRSLHDEVWIHIVVRHRCMLIVQILCRGGFEMFGDILVCCFLRCMLWILRCCFRLLWSSPLLWFPYHIYCKWQDLLYKDGAQL